MNKSIGYTQIEGNVYHSTEQALFEIKELRPGLEEWKKSEVNSLEYTSNVFAPVGFGGYLYSLKITVSHTLDNTSCVIFSATLIPSKQKPKNNRAYSHMQIFKYQYGTYKFYGHTMTISKPEVVLSGFKTKNETTDKRYRVLFDNGRAVEYVLPVGLKKDRVDEVAQMAIHDLIVDRINHWENYDSPAGVYARMIQEKYKEVLTLESCLEKIDELSAAVTDFNMPRFITSAASEFRTHFEEVSLYRTEEAFSSLYPVLKRPYSLDKSKK